VPVTLPWLLPLVAALAGAALGELVRRRLTRRDYRYADEVDVREPRQWWLPPVGAAAWAGLVLGLQARPATLLVMLALTLPLLVLAGVDHDVHRLPDRIQKPLAVVLPLVLLLPAAVEGDWGAWVRALAGGAVAFVVYLVLAIVGRGALGLGDVKLAFILGVACAWFSWTTLASGLVAGFFLASFWGAWLMLARGASRKTYIPLGPFLIVGALGTMAVLT
jgi:leader peptidase (prepilin peptidase) / N-methyltransferase